MVARQSELFQKPTPPRRRVMARMIDAGQYPDGRMACEFACKRCGWVQWLAVKTKMAGKRGHPCPNCNKSS